MWTKLCRTNREKFLIAYGEHIAAFRKTYKMQIFSTLTRIKTTDITMEVLCTAKKGLESFTIFCVF